MMDQKSALPPQSEMQQQQQQLGETSPLSLSLVSSGPAKLATNIKIVQVCAAIILKAFEI